MPDSPKGVVVKYDGPADIRKITKADFKSEADVDQDAVEWSKKNGFKVEVSQETADYLVANDPDHFSVVEAEAKTPA